MKRNIDEIVVLKTCAYCGKLFIPNHIRRIFCYGECVSKSSADKVIIRNRISNKHLRHSKKVKQRESLGTWATHITFPNAKVERMFTDRDGNPDFEKEAKIVQYLKRNTLSKRHPSHGYTPTFGDRQRFNRNELRNISIVVW